jgi:hypothetical protein
MEAAQKEKAGMEAAQTEKPAREMAQHRGSRLLRELRLWELIRLSKDEKVEMVSMRRLRQRVVALCLFS